MSFEKILVALDRSAQADLVFEKAVDVARKYNGSLLIFHTIHFETAGDVAPLVGTGIGLSPAGGATLPQIQQERLQVEIEQVDRLLQKYAKQAIEAGVATEVDRAIGDAGHWICDRAKQWPADLIVLGRRGRKGLSEMFLGSVSNHVSHNAPCCVLIVQGIPRE